MVNSAAKAGDRIDKLSQQLGLSREGFQEWDFILSQSGTSVESLKQGMKTLIRSVDDLTLGTGVGAEAFQRLGIELEDIQGLTQEEIFEKVVTELQKMEEGTEKAALAQDLLGRSGQELMPLLNAEAGSVEELKNKAQELGLVLGDDAVDASVKFTDTVDQLKRSFGTIKNELGVALMPTFQKFADLIIKNMPTIRKAVVGAFELIVSAGEKVYNFALKPIISFFQDNWQTIETLALKGARGVLVALKFIVDGLNAFTKTKFAKKIGEGFSIMADGIVKAGSWMWNKLVKYWNEHGDEIKLASSVIWNSITTGWDKMTNWIGTTAAKMWIGLVDLWEKHGGTIKKVGGEAWDFSKSKLLQYMKTVDDFIRMWYAFATGDWKTGMEKLKSITTDVQKSVSDNLNKIFTGWKNVGEKIEGYVVELWDNVRIKTINALEKIATAIKEWFTELPNKIAKKAKNNASNIATAIVGDTTGAIVDGLNLGITQSSKALKISKDALKNFEENGENIVAGIIKGINSKQSELGTTTEDLAKTTEDGYKEGMDIHSPSRVMMALGIHTVMGLMQGIQSKGAELDEESRKLAEKTLEVFSKDLNFSNGADTGADYTEGLATGIKSEGVKAEKTAEKTGENVGEKLGKGLLDKTSDTIGGMIDVIDDKLASIGKKVGDVITDYDREYIKFYDNLVKNSESAYKDVADASDKSSKKVKKNNQETAESFATTASKASDVFEQAGDLIGGKLGGVLDGVGVSLGGVSEVSGGVAKAMTGDWMGAATSIMSGVKNLASGLEGIFGGLFGKRKSELDLYKEQWGEFVEGIDGELQTFAEDISETFINAFEDIGKQIKVLKGQVYATIESWNEMQDAMKESGVDTLIALKEQVEEFGIDVQNSILAIDEGLWDSSTGYSSLIKTIISGTGELVDEAMESSEALTSEGLNAIRNLVNGAMENIEPILKEFEELTKTEADKLGDAITEALEKKYQEELEQKEQAIEDKAKLAEEELQAEVDALNKKYDTLREKEQKRIDDLLDKKKQETLAREYLSDEEKNKEIESLKKQAEDYMKQFDERFQNEIARKEKEKEKKINLIKEENEQELKLLHEKYDALMEADALENKALQLATAENQQELLALLKEYNPKWQDAGQSFGDKLINGLNSTKQDMYFAVKDILDNVDLVQNAMSELESQQEKITQATINQVQQQQAQQQAEQQAQQQQQQPTGRQVGVDQYGQPIYAQTPTRSSGAEKRDININITTPKQLSEAELMRIARDNAVQLAMMGG